MKEFERLLTRLVLTTLCLMFVIACGSSGDGDSDTDSPGDVGGSSGGILLGGNPLSLASEAMIDYDSGDRTTDDEISIDTNGARIDRTNLSISFVSMASVDEINLLLLSVEGKIVNMLPGVSIMLVKIPDPGDLSGLDSIIAQLQANPVVIDVLKVGMVETQSLPGNYESIPTDRPIDSIDHHIAVSAPAAWNARKALKYSTSSPPLLVIGDGFRGGAPNSDYNLNLLDPDDFKTGDKPVRHGYHVLGIISGAQNSNASETSPRQLVTGIYPDSLDIRAIDFSGELGSFNGGYNTATGENRMLRVIAKSSRKAVLSTSLITPCGIPPERECQLKNALRWIQKLRGDVAYRAGVPGGLESKFLHITAAGNWRGGNDTQDASLASAWTAARLMAGLKTNKNVLLKNLSNTLVVENRKNTLSAPPAPFCLSESSKFPGDLSAIGHNVSSFSGPNLGEASLSGTSMSTPQVSGLATYVWALKPSLTPQEVLDILVNTSGTVSIDENCRVTPRPIIDAYAAVLAVDDKNVLIEGSNNPLDAPARLSILDIADASGKPGQNNAFDRYDLEDFIRELETRSGKNLDYSRYDLNGDGFTGESTPVFQTRFNLDIDYPPTYGKVFQNINGQTTEFDENAVTDWEMLCYYSYSPLYTGDKDLRDSEWFPHQDKCGSKGQQILFVDQKDPFDQSGVIYAMNPDGSGRIPLTTVAGFQRPLWSPDGKKIVYEQPNAWRGEILVMDADGANKQNITKADPFYDGRPVWSPGGTEIAFVSGRDDFYGDVWVMDADGENISNFTKNTDPDLPQKPSDSQPAWSPEGSKIAFTSNRNDDVFEIYLMNSFDGSGVTRLTNGSDPMFPSASTYPTWSPDGTRIAFWSTRDSAAGDFFVMNADGSGQTRLTLEGDAGGHRKDFVVWSPDGTKILFESAIAGSIDIWIMDADGSNRTNLTAGLSGWDQYPVWSPDGTKIIFSSNRDIVSRYNIWIMDPDGSNQQNLTPPGSGISGKLITPDW